MTRIGFLIPEFPGQTHAFFMRERAELVKLGVATELISTRRPVAGSANHAWVEAVVKETTYLSPLGFGQMLSGIGTVVLAGPLAWFRCLEVVFGGSDMGLKERLTMFAMMVAGAVLLSICRRKGLRHVHVHSCANSANVALFARLLGGPSYSLTLHGPLGDYGTNQVRKWENAAFGIVITRDLLNEVRNTLRRAVLPPVYLAPMGVDIDFFRRSTAYVPTRPSETVRLVSCGRLNRGKAHDDLIRAVAGLKEKGMDVRLNICGAVDSSPGAEDYFAWLKNLCRELGVEDRVQFLGSVPEDRVKEELESAHFFCLASLQEALGVATMEAMAMEIPVIVTRHPGVCEMVDDGVNGILVEPRSPGQFVEAIMHLAGSPEEAVNIARKGRMKVVQYFHSGISASRIMDGLERTI